MVTAQSFKPANLDGTPVSAAQMQALEQAIRYLSQDAEAAALLKQAAGIVSVPKKRIPIYRV